MLKGFYDNDKFYQFIEDGSLCSCDKCELEQLCLQKDSPICLCFDTGGYFKINNNIKLVELNDTL